MLFKVQNSPFFRGEPNTGAGPVIIKTRAQEPHAKLEFHHLSCCWPSHPFDFGVCLPHQRHPYHFWGPVREVSRLWPGQLDAASPKGARVQPVTGMPHQLVLLWGFLLVVVLLFCFWFQICKKQMLPTEAKAKDACVCHHVADPSSGLPPPPVKQVAIIYKNTAHTGF